MTTETPRRKLSPDALRVESFEPLTRADALEFVAPPTNPIGSMPPCCSDRYVCI